MDAALQQNWGVDYAQSRGKLQQRLLGVGCFNNSFNQLSGEKI
jgi:hypothetical protein